MLLSTFRRFDDPNEYAGAMRAAKSEVTLTASGQFAAHQSCIDLQHLRVDRFADNLPRIWYSGPETGRAVISFRTDPGPGLFSDGLEMRPSTLTRHAVGQVTFQRSCGSASWCSISLPLEKMASIEAASECSQTLPRHNATITPSPHALAKLHRLHAVAQDLAKDAPEIIAIPEAARGLEQALIGALIACLYTATSPQRSAVQGRHESIMRRFQAAIEEHSKEAVYLPDLCAAISVPHRTLHMCCYESLGVGPKRYLLLRRMNLAREALRKAERAAATVTAIAAGLGFWNFGRFSVEYKSLFGETPSATLHTQSPCPTVATDRLLTVRPFAKSGQRGVFALAR